MSESSYPGVGRVPGVSGIEVSAQTGRLAVTGADIDVDDVVSAVSEAGYAAVWVS